jgi:hypothetical protein
MNHPANVEHDGSGYACGKVVVIETVLERTEVVRRTIVDTRVQIGNVVHNLPSALTAAPRGEGRSAVGSRKSWNRLRRKATTSCGHT